MEPGYIASESFPQELNRETDGSMQDRPWEPTFEFLERKQASTPGCKRRGQNSTIALNKPPGRGSGEETSAEDQETKQAVAKRREGRV